MEEEEEKKEELENNFKELEEDPGSETKPPEENPNNPLCKDTATEAWSAIRPPRPIRL